MNALCPKLQRKIGMQSLDRCLPDWVKQSPITAETAMVKSGNPDFLPKAPTPNQVAATSSSIDRQARSQHDFVERLRNL